MTDLEKMHIRVRLSKECILVNDSKIIYISEMLFILSISYCVLGKRHLYF